MKLLLCITTTLLALVALPFLILTKKGEKFGKKRAYIMIFCSALFFASVFVGAKPFFSILENYWPGGLYAAEITPVAQLFVIPLAGTGEMELNVKNRGTLTWDSADNVNPVLLSWHLMSEEGTMIRFDNKRTPFPHPILPGESGRVVVQMSPASEGIPVGRYLIEFDLVQENVTWFANRGSATCRVRLEVLP